MLPALTPSLLSLVLSGGTPAEEGYLAAIPRPAGIVVLVPDAPELLRRAQDSRWTQFLLEEVLGDKREKLLEELFDGSQMTGIMDALESLQAFAGFAPLDLSDSQAAFGAVVKFDPERGAVEAWIESFLGHEISSESGVVHVQPLADGDHVALSLEEDVLVLFAGANPEGLEEEVGQALSRLQENQGSPLDAGYLKTAHAQTPAGSHIEVLALPRELVVASDPAVVEEPNVRTIVEEMHWAQASFRIGSGESLESQFKLRVGKQGLLAEFLDLFVKPTSGELFASMPKDVQGVSAGLLDLTGLAELVLKALALEPSGESSQQAEMFIEGMETQLGFHLIDDLIAVFTGEFAMFSQGLDLPDNQEALLGIDIQEDLLTRDTFLLGLHAGDDLIDYLDTVITQFGVEPMLEFGEAGEFETYSLVIESEDVSMHIGISDGLAVLASHQDDLSLVAKTIAGDGPSIRSHPKLGPRVDTFPGPFSLNETSSAIEVLLGTTKVILTQELVTSGEEAWLLEGITELLDGGAKGFFKGTSAYWWGLSEGVVTWGVEAR